MCKHFPYLYLNNVKKRGKSNGLTFAYVTSIKINSMTMLLTKIELAVYHVGLKLVSNKQYLREKMVALHIRQCMVKEQFLNPQLFS
jgi:hypothetical protein